MNNTEIKKGDSFTIDDKQFELLDIENDTAILHYVALNKVFCYGLKALQHIVQMYGYTINEKG